jgi:hypothetical protein
VVLSLFPNGGAISQEIGIEAGSVCYVNKFKFDNQGGYELDRFTVGKYEYNGALSQGQTRTWKLSKANVSPADVVFLRYQIDQGNAMSWKSCKKDGTTLKYHPSGNTWNYWSRGSTRFNNRCRFRNNTCIKSVQD